jgi:glucosamine-6-phosphate deaminase
MKFIICSDEHLFGQKAADFIENQISKKPDIVLGLPTGSTPVDVYQELIQRYKNGKLDLSRVTTFNLDEYIGIPHSHPCSYHTFMKQNLFNHINIPPQNTHIPKGESESLEQECAEYEKLIKEAGGIDLQVLGIGRNGHIGFNEPGTPFDSVTHITNLTPSTIDANSIYFDSSESIPRQAITMGIGTIMKAGKILLLAKGSSKSDAVYKAFFGPVTTDMPASVLQRHPDVTVILDREAASKLDLAKIHNIPHV